MLKLTFFLFFLTACIQSSNSDSNDRALSTTVPGAFGEAFAVLEDKCMSCHSGYHNAWRTYTTREHWTQEGLIVIGDAMASELVIRIQNAGTPSSDMPLGGPPLADGDYDKIVNWIDGL